MDQIANLAQKPPSVVERNIALLEIVMRYFLAQPQVFQALPDDFELVVLPEDDPEMLRYNLDLLNQYGSAGKPIVFARVKSTLDLTRVRPDIYVPLAV
ncbi:MAG: hypothetical protein L0Y55_20450 [Anaerolineales bacterium]|nr:hypothetical protein [Anaerolineales bacterium]